AGDGLPGEGDPLGAFAEDVELLREVGDGVDVAGVGLPGAEVFVLEEKVGVGAEGCLALESAGGGDALGFGGERGARGESLLDGIGEAQARLGVAGASYDE